MSLTLNLFFHCVRYALEKSNYREIFLKVKQLIILESLLLGVDTIGVLPTGYGKSIIFHLLPFLFEHYYGGEAGETIVLVVAPLNSLIYDQVRSLNDRGIKAAILTKGSIRGVEDESDENDEIFEDCDVIDIEQDDALVFSQSGLTFYRLVFAHPEAFISCNEEKRKRKPTRQGAESYEAEILPIALGLKDLQINYPLTIIYLPLKWCGYAYKFFLEVLGNKAYYPSDCIKTPHNCLIAQYHAPQTTEMKDEILRQLTRNANQSVIRVIFGTIAIGLGVNIPNVRQVVHLEVPRTMESYYQEIGRAGRDGKPAKAVLCFNATDIAHNKPGMTEEMRIFCLSEEACMRKQLLTYLGSLITTCDLNHCCSNCQKIAERSCMTGCSGLSMDDSQCQEMCQLNAVRVTTQKQQLQLYIKLRQYRLQLGNSRCRFGSIDSNTGVTLQLLSEITAKCEYISSVEDICNLFEIWDVAHADAFFHIIQEVYNSE